MRYQIVPAEPAHVAHVAQYMRRADRDEVHASSGMDPEEALRLSAQVSEECYAGIVDGEPVCIFGVGRRSLLSGTGVPWLLGVEGVERHARHLLEASRLVVAEWRQRFDRLENHVDARNTKSIRWLRWLGFTIHDAAPYGVHRLPFHRFETSRS